MRKPGQDAESVEAVRAMLVELGCPDIRAGERSPEWERTKGSYKDTPDLVAGPLVGGGDPSDYYVDVFEPTGDQYFREQVGQPDTVAAVTKLITERVPTTMTDLKEPHDLLVKTMNAELTKYSRGGTPMIGLGMYFKMMADSDPERPPGPVFAGIQALLGLDAIFGIEHRYGVEAMQRVVRGVIGEGEQKMTVIVPMRVPLAFALYVARMRELTA